MPRIAGLTPFTKADVDESAVDVGVYSEGEEEFASRPPTDQIKRRLSGVDHPQIKKAPQWITLTPMYIGIAGNLATDKSTLEIGLSIHDATYSIDFSIKHLHFPNNEPEPKAIADFIINTIIEFSKEHLMKFVGAGVTSRLVELSPNLCGRLWRELDIVPLVFHVRSTQRLQPGRPVAKLDAQGFPIHSTGVLTPLPGTQQQQAAVQPPQSNLLSVAAGTAQTQAADASAPVRPADEQADSAVRKAVLYFGPSGHNPRLSIGFRNEVEPDAAGRIRIVDSIEDYRSTVREPTWNAVLHYAKILREKKTKIAFFSSTPQGGGVALMRHALIRLFHLLGVDAKWYIPSPSPAVFRITKNNHNILQGVADPSLRLTQAQQDQFTQWITYNANRYWLSEGGPLAPGGADVIFIDDPQMPGLIPLIRKVRPEVPILYRSHIEVRSDLIHQEGSPQSEVWDYLWSRIQQADMFISHPVDKFVPDSVKFENVGLLPATTDWLDGLSKHMGEWDIQYYMGIFRTLCSEIRMSKLHWPAREYIVQVARFDPAKGIPVVIDSFVKLRRKLDLKLPASQCPQLLICGHGAIDDPDASIIYSETLALLETEEYAPYASDIVVMRIPPSDQILNALMSSAKIVLQLSSREGFEVKVSEAIHKGKPIIATRAGGIPLQVQHGKNGFLVDVGDSSAVAKHLYQLWTDPGLYKQMCEYAKRSVSDEVGTWGNAAAWMYLATKFAAGEKLKPNGKWINDMMREDCGQPYTDDEPRLPRKVIKPGV
ncbi:Trehalose phosphorylase {ECO:0000312/EMBL:ABR88135.1}; AltName: Full=Trehalose synthase {ECO:0000250/UniProtKB:O75003}; Short=TSase {ECO:0000250/UniProtKB:O75003}; Flags: Precursor [Serendipita indica DSM 11827]|uniref:Probable trehalose synthase [clock-controlled gene-9] n=1 Tax=Serendipita indica (strain DSM 11827) TaxID=1109443 RepID=G4T895_SERID|nr:Trehalose phosphorylase {ECO:0000312/EMBL:ABR88135.1}; AltName: Full=Trehalose synthase {ECO:0000250/UniProtKB:O75003}; Short=TSase {ECO:0000250/UniProtKB:O75003}; Flags: Precursor [Serendipita indica DSM 11827]CCA67519.1 probable trehalose synthase [clock-controlled gene-9] [Serendipita indica DSM 11827]